MWSGTKVWYFTLSIHCYIIIIIIIIIIYRLQRLRLVGTAYQLTKELFTVMYRCII